MDGDCSSVSSVSTAEFCWFSNHAFIFPICFQPCFQFSAETNGFRRMGWILFISWASSAKQQQPRSCSIPVTCGENSSSIWKVLCNSRGNLQGRPFIQLGMETAFSKCGLSLFKGREGFNSCSVGWREGMCFVPPSEGEAPCWAGRASTHQSHCCPWGFALKRFCLPGLQLSIFYL